MSHAIGAARFADGLIRFYEYDGTADVCDARLRATPDEVWEHWRGEICLDRCTCERDEPVEIHTTYGGEFAWNGRACRYCGVLTDGRDPYHVDSEDKRDAPNWTQGIYRLKDDR